MELKFEDGNVISFFDNPKKEKFKSSIPPLFTWFEPDYIDDPTMISPLKGDILLVRRGKHYEEIYLRDSPKKTPTRTFRRVSGQVFDGFISLGILRKNAIRYLGNAIILSR